VEDLSRDGLTGAVQAGVTVVGGAVGNALRARYVASRGGEAALAWSQRAAAGLVEGGPDGFIGGFAGGFTDTALADGTLRDGLAPGLGRSLQAGLEGGAFGAVIGGVAGAGIRTAGGLFRTRNASDIAGIGAGRFQGNRLRLERVCGQNASLCWSRRQCRRQGSGIIDLSTLVDDVVYDPAGSYFTVVNGRRILSIGGSAFERNRVGQLQEAAHELVHAQQFQKYRSRGSFASIDDAANAFFKPSRRVYARQERVAEHLSRLRIRRYRGGMSPEQWAASTRYINSWKRRSP
jgi:hypothetical protein